MFSKEPLVPLSVISFLPNPGKKGYHSHRGLEVLFFLQERKFPQSCHTDEGRITQETPQRKVNRCRSCNGDFSFLPMTFFRIKIKSV